jgi:hypothetical protein
MSSYEHDLVAAAVIGERATPGGWIRMNCPLCLDKEGKADRKCSFGFSVRSYRYECYRCGSKGRLRDAPEQYDILPQTSESKPEPVRIEAPEGFYFLEHEKSISLAPAWDYLRNVRGLTTETIRNARLGACISGRFEGRVIVPIFNPDGTWAWFVGRVWRKKADRPYLYPSGARHGLMYNSAALAVETSEPVMVVEGCFDAIAHYPNAVAVLGKTTDEHLSILAGAKRPVVFVPDGDEWESGYALSLRLRLLGVRSGAVKLPPRVDPDEVDRDLLRNICHEAVA